MPRHRGFRHKYGVAVYQRGRISILSLYIPLTSRPAAGEGDDLAGDEIGFVGRQEGDQGGEFFRLAEAAQGDVGEYLVARLGVGSGEFPDTLCALGRVDIPANFGYAQGHQGSY